MPFDWLMRGATSVSFHTTFGEKKIYEEMQKERVETAKMS